MFRNKIVACLPRGGGQEQFASMREYVKVNMPEFSRKKVMRFSGYGKASLHKDLMKLIKRKSRQPRLVLFRTLADITISISPALRLVFALAEAGVEVVFIDQPELTLRADTPHRQQVIATYKCYVAAESSGLKTRIKSGLEVAQAKGKKLGAPRKIVGEEAEFLIRMGWSGATRPRSVGECFGVSRSTVVRLLDEAEASGWRDPTVR